MSTLLNDSPGGRSPRIKLCGSRGSALKSFRTSTDSDPVLLVDSECSLLDSDPVTHLLLRGDIDKGHVGSFDSADVFLMIETMENWLIADIEAVATTKPDLAVKARDGVKGNVEDISKAEAERVVAACLGPREAKGDRMELIGKINPSVLAQRAPEFARLLKRLHR
jgi:hypothetical protein